MKLNHLYRIVTYYEQEVVYQCLSCKQSFSYGEDDVINYCPKCGIKFEKLFIKKNERYNPYDTGTGWHKHYYPKITIYRQETSIKQILDPIAIGFEYKTERKLQKMIDWSEFLGSISRNRNFAKEFKKIVKSLRNSEPLKCFIERSDGSRKEYELRKS